MVNRENYVMVKKFLIYLDEVCGLKTNSIERYRFHLRHLLIWSDEKAFGNITNIRPTFQSFVSILIGKAAGTILSSETQSRIVETARRFLNWAKTNYPAEYRNLSPAWLDNLQIRKTVDVHPEHEYVTLEEVQCLARLSMPENNLALRRDQAAAAALFLSGMRASAFTTAPIQAFDFDNKCVYQWPNEYRVATKNGKKATTYLLPIPELLTIAVAWDGFVRSALPPTYPWYTPIRNEWGEQTLSTDDPGKNRNQALDKRLRILFTAAGLEYKSAHKFRHGHAVYGLQHSPTMADYKAVSMNLMHADIRTTDGIYAGLLSKEVKTRIAGLGSCKSDKPCDPFENYVRNLSNDELAVLMKVGSERLAA